MNYDHHYHAGNFADVFKHSLLVRLVIAFFRKMTPFCYIDTHAGSGRYDLRHHAAKATQESQVGITTLLTQTDVPAALYDYLAIVRQGNMDKSDKQLLFYPGSPTIVKALLREQDKMQLNEKQSDVLEKLKKNMGRDKRVIFHQEDGYHCLKSLLPPIEKRGLVLIDPPFEEKQEFDCIIAGLKEAHKRWLTGVFAIWYPIKSERELLRFYRDLKQLDQKILCAEMMLYKPDTPVLGLNGCGMIFVNPPYLFDAHLETMVGYLWKVFSPAQQGHYRVTWITNT